MDTVQELLEQACRDHGDVSFRNTYSGRGMYGRQCVGITGDSHECRRVIAAVITEMVGVLTDGGEEFQSSMMESLEQDVETLMLWDQDSMGRDVIYYWPSLESIEEVEPEHDGQPDEAQEWHDFDPDC